MSDQELETKLAALYTDPPWRTPKELPPPASGDAAIDALFDLAAGIGDPNVWPRIEEIKKRAGEPVLRATAMRFIEHVLDERPPIPYQAYSTWNASLQVADEALRTPAQTRTNEAAKQWFTRGWIVQALCEALLLAPDETLLSSLVAWLEKPADDFYRGLVAHALVNATTDAKYLEPLAKHFVSGDPLVAIAAVATALMRKDDALSAVRETFATLQPTERYQVAIQLTRRKEIDFDAQPDWADVLYPGVLGQPWALEASYKLHTVRTVEPLLRSLKHTDEDVYWTDILARLRTLDDVAAAAPLEEIAKTLPEQKKGERLSRTSNTLLTLVKRLRRKRETIDKASFETQPGVGTDGGPIVILPGDVAKEWQGVPADWNGQGNSDYDNACAVSDEGVGVVKVGKKKALAIGEQNVGVAMLADGAAMLVVHGTDLQIEITMRERGAWKKTRHTLEVGAGGAVLLDAAHTLANAPEGGEKKIGLGPGTYDVYEMRRDDIFALKLAPKKKR